jgi:hypothetical protein
MDLRQANIASPAWCRSCSVRCNMSVLDDPHSSDTARVRRKVAFAVLLAAIAAGLRELLIKFDLLGFGKLPGMFLLTFVVLALSATMGAITHEVAYRSQRRAAQQARRMQKILEFTSLDEAIAVHRDELNRLQVDSNTAQQLARLNDDERRAIERIFRQTFERQRSGFWREQILLLLTGAILGAIASELLHWLLGTSLWQSFFP